MLSSKFIDVKWKHFSAYVAECRMVKSKAKTTLGAENKMADFLATRVLQTKKRCEQKLPSTVL
jgi:hypothetical protein